MIDFRLCKNRRINVALKAVLLFVSLVIIVLFALYIKNEDFDYKKELFHSIEIVIRFCFILITVDYIRIKLKK